MKKRLLLLPLFALVVAADKSSDDAVKGELKKLEGNPFRREL